MPGTIQVSVLDFKGLHSSLLSSHILLKVSMGKIEYQTQDKGEFSFPLTTLRDNLIITLEDDEGNEISHTGVETRLVVEKGVWEDIFSLEGGGHVHMKLQFVLSEEEHQIIQIVRESELKKKHEELCNNGRRRSFSAPSSHGSPESLLQNILLATEASLVSVPIRKQRSTNDRDENEGNTSAKTTSQLVNVHRAESCHPDSVHSKLEKANNLKKQRPAGKAHSNVRQMISAFEGSLNQDIKPSIKPPSKVSRTRKTRVDIFMANSHHTEVETEKIIPPKVTADAGTTVQVTADASTSTTKENEDRKTSQKLRPKLENSMDLEDTIGPVRQIKSAADKSPLPNSFKSFERSSTH
ncbi:hypothetical protein PTKIN_Ptkin03bG0235100 [Pterospermum kingtungense]